jgi:hypothetical protein
VLERLRPEIEPTIDGLFNGLACVRELRALADGPGRLDACRSRACARGATFKDGRLQALEPNANQPHAMAWA